MGSAAMNDSGDIAVGYSVSGSGTFPSVRYTTRAATDPLGVLPGGEVEMIAGTGAQTSSSNRWGDYSAMSVDPVDGCTFWFTEEYYETHHQLRLQDPHRCLRRSGLLRRRGLHGHRADRGDLQ